jgi:cation diffusion facilitator family transporter
LGWWLVKQGRRQNSKAIEADGHHVLSDFYTTLGLLVGLLAVKFFGFTWLDPLLALGIGGLLAATGYKLVRGSAAALLDQEDPRLIVKLVAAMNRVRTDDVVAIHALRTLRSGRYTHVDIHVAVPEYYPIGQAHDLIEKFGQAAIVEAGEEGEFHAHVDPCDRFYCKCCAVSGCLIRAEACSGRRDFSVAEAVSPGPNDDRPPAYSSSPLDLTQNQMRP